MLVLGISTRFCAAGAIHISVKLVQLSASLVLTTRPNASPEWCLDDM